MRESLKRVLCAQLLLGVAWVGVVVVITLGFSDAEYGLGVAWLRVKSAALGAGLGIVATLITARSVQKSARAAIQTPQLAMLPMFSGLLLKLLVVAGGAFLGLVYFQLRPFYFLCGYLIVQAGFFWAGNHDATQRDSRQS